MRAEEMFKIRNASAVNSNGQLGLGYPDVAE